MVGHFQVAGFDALYRALANDCVACDCFNSDFLPFVVFPVSGNWEIFRKTMFLPALFLNFLVYALEI